MYTNVILRVPATQLAKGLRLNDLGEVNHELALKQHNDYLNALKSCQVDITLLSALDTLPDSCFVEDVAICTDKCAIITNPQHEIRQKEVEYILPCLRRFFGKQLEFISAPATLEGGDVLNIGKHFYVGLSQRTNMEGAQALKNILAKYNYECDFIELKDLLHLKCGVANLGRRTLLIDERFINEPAFKPYNHVVVCQEEAYAANAISVNGRVIMAKGFPKTKKALIERRFEVIEVDTSEFYKVDGGLSCLSLRF